MKPTAEYRAEVIGRHRDAFDLWQATARLYSEAASASRTRPTNVHLVLDMLFLQACNAHASVALVAQHGLMEDAATIVRRLLEISIQATYIGEEDDPKLKDRKAGQYLSFLWRKLPRRSKRILPTQLRAEWTAIARSFGRFVPAKSKSWGPSWRVMFKACGLESLYTSDYAFLSGIAHGSPEEQVLRFSMATIRAHDDRHVSTLLVYSSKYYSVMGEIWNNHFNLLASDRVEALRSRLVQWRRRPAT